MVIHWHQPVFPGDTVRLVLQVESLDEKPSRRSGRVVFSARMLNQKNQLVIDGVWTTLMMRQRRRERGADGGGSSGEGGA
jgi:acyl dehydratase